jgi:hypothetical protein
MNEIADNAPTVGPPSSSPAPSPEEAEREVVGTVNMPSSHVRIRPDDSAPIDIDVDLADQAEQRQAFVDRQHDESAPKLSKSQARSLLDEVERPAMRDMVNRARAEVEEAEALVNRADPQPLQRDPTMPDTWGDELAPAWGRLSPQERSHFTQMTQAQQQWATQVVGELQRAQQTRIGAEEMAISAAIALEPQIAAYGVNSEADLQARAAVPEREKPNAAGHASSARAEEIADGWNGPFLRDHRAQLIIMKAAKWDQAQAKLAAASPTRAPPPQRPGTSNPSGGDNSLEKAAAAGDMATYVKLREKGRTR